MKQLPLLNPDYQPNFSLPGYRDLGWQPPWLPEVHDCISQGHRPRQIDNSYTLLHGSDVLTICDQCKYIAHTDMSD